MSSSKITMPYVRLGKSGLKVSRIILGCMSYGNKTWQGQGWILDEKEGIEHIKAAYAAGINTFDTANIYSDGESERILGKAIKEIDAPRSSFVIMTKVFGEILPEGLPEEARGKLEQYGITNNQGLSRKHIFDSIKASLERLQLDYVDLYQCHRFDPDTPIAETMQALHDRSGRVCPLYWDELLYGLAVPRYAKSVNPPCFSMIPDLDSSDYAINNGLTPFISMQNFQSVIYREEEREMNPTCAYFGVGTIPWSPLSRGLLCRPRNTETTLRLQTDSWISVFHKEDDPNLAIIDRVEELAKKKNVSMSQIALAWVMAKDPVAAPIVGTTKLVNIMDAIKSVEVKLDEDEMKYLEEMYTSRAISGH